MLSRRVRAKYSSASETTGRTSSMRLSRSVTIKLAKLCSRGKRLVKGVCWREALLSSVLPVDTDKFEADIAETVMPVAGDVCGPEWHAFHRRPAPALGDLTIGGEVSWEEHPSAQSLFHHKPRPQYRVLVEIGGVEEWPQGVSAALAAVVLAARRENSLDGVMQAVDRLAVAGAIQAAFRVAWPRGRRETPLISESEQVLVPPVCGEGALELWRSAGTPSGVGLLRAAVAHRGVAVAGQVDEALRRIRSLTEDARQIIVGRRRIGEGVRRDLVQRVDVQCAFRAEACPAVRARHEGTATWDPIAAASAAVRYQSGSGTLPTKTDDAVLAEAAWALPKVGGFSCRPG